MKRSWLLSGTAFLGDLKLIDVLCDSPFLTDITHTSQIVPRRFMTQTLAPLKFQTYTLNCFSECNRLVLLIQQTYTSPTEPIVFFPSVSHGLCSPPWFVKHTILQVDQPEATLSISSFSFILENKLAVITYSF